MKRILLAALLSCLFINVNAQGISYISSRTGVFGGVGLATSHNYDMGISGGLEFDKSVFSRTAIGATLFLQGFSLYYDNEINSMKHGQGYTGVTLRHDSKYIFFAPQVKYQLGYRRNICYWISVNAGIGMKMSGYDSLRKWDHSYDSASVLRYDSTIDASKNLKSMVYRVGVTLAQDLYLGGGDWWFTFREDFGFLTSPLTGTGEAGIQSPSRTLYSPQNVSPAYISFQIGISYLKTKTNKVKKSK